MSPSDDVRFIAKVMTEVQSDPTEPMTVDAIINHAREVVADADHVSLTVRGSRGRFTTLASTSRTAERLDELQYELEEGPCLDAYGDADWLRTGDIGQDPRWPRWGPKAAEAGGASLCSIPMLVRGERVGALNMYSDRHGAFGDREVIDMASIYAVHASYALSSARKVAGLEAAIQSRHMIGMAQGILIERFQLDPGRAFALLCRVSSTQNRRVRDIAEELVETNAIAGSEIGPRPHE